MVDETDLFDFFLPMDARCCRNSFHRDVEYQLAADGTAVADEGFAGRAKAAARDATRAFIPYSLLGNPTAARGNVAGIITAPAVVVMVKAAAVPPGMSRLILAPAVFDDHIVGIDAALGFDPVAAIIRHMRSSRRRQMTRERPD